MWDFKNLSEALGTFLIVALSPLLFAPFAIYYTVAYRNDPTKRGRVLTRMLMLAAVGLGMDALLAGFTLWNPALAGLMLVAILVKAAKRSGGESDV